MNIDGSEQKNITQTDLLSEREPRFSPDGSKIVFICSIEGSREICIMNTDGSNCTRLTYTEDDEWDPQFSHDGLKLIYTRNNGDQEIYIMNVDGINQTNLSNIYGYDRYPAVQPRN